MKCRVVYSRWRRKRQCCFQKAREWKESITQHPWMRWHFRSINAFESSNSITLATSGTFRDGLTVRFIQKTAHQHHIITPLFTHPPFSLPKFCVQFSLLRQAPELDFLLPQNAMNRRTKRGVLEVEKKLMAFSRLIRPIKKKEKMLNEASIMIKGYCLIVR